MNIVLPKPQEDWLEARVTDGSFASVEEALAQIVEERMRFEAEDARPESEAELAGLIESLDAARAEVAQGTYLTLAEHRARNAERLARIRGT